MIETWLASKAIKIAILVLAALGLVMTPAMIVQTVRINGISFFGLYAVDGYRPMYERAALNNGTLLANQSNLTAAVKSCNASIDGLKSAGDLLTAKAQALADLAKGLQGQFSSNIAAMHAIQSTDEKCPVADQIIQRVFK